MKFSILNSLQFDWLPLNQNSTIYVSFLRLRVNAQHFAIAFLFLFNILFPTVFFDRLAKTICVFFRIC